MQFRVLIPPNVKTGQCIRIRCPDGTEGDVQIPKGLKSGDSFVFEMPESDVKSGDSRNKHDKKNKKRSFLDREIVHFRDLGMALLVGLLIGVSIIIGFLAGVLWVTDPEEVDAPPVKMIPTQPTTTDNNGGGSCDAEL